MEHKDYVSIHPGTQVTRSILNALGSPDERLQIIHIAGTNGKGSTAEFFTRILISAGIKTGTFSSPSVYTFNDQFKINGVELSDGQIEEYFAAAQSAAKGLDATDFEIQTAAIIYAFYKEGCEYAVIECGMGGLNDATNAVKDKRLAVITSISLEHTAYLGDTIESICAHKTGIITNGCPAVGNAHQSKEAKDYLKAKGVNLADGVTDLGGGCFLYNGVKYELSVSGSMQPYNAATAIAGARLLGISEKAISEGIKNARPLGRLEKFEVGNRAFVLDGAHNPAAFEPFAQYIVNYRDSLTVIFGCLADKDVDGILKILSRITDKITAVECVSPRKMPLEKILGYCRKYFKSVKTANSVSDALSTADTKTVAVCGSFTLLTEAKQWIEKLTEKKQ